MVKEHRRTGSLPYTLYTVTDETAMDSDNPGSIQPVAYHTVNRRYSEFLNLQTRLEEKSDLRKFLKGFNSLSVAGLEAFIKERELAVMQRLRGKAVQPSEEKWEAHRIIYQVHPFKILFKTRTKFLHQSWLVIVDVCVMTASCSSRQCLSCFGR
ncbi:uncharacterized protein LOC118936438 isoform X2 [Oncorhynchus mykiss]|uniref:uncharacterized protein LOC118936438 isoform X2 n=1 Tax=Oncorhynchus mykiss TaxID=8022 RepID=UPI001877AD63|nr:uncharacterized protein LOC118936438 isoform X2 [Oncorhynchus mykiss]XP_036821671.1 uncharacterized protein LOC118936438 isoform X2 [Oncorhynchus mykiss]